MRDSLRLEEDTGVAASGSLTIIETIHEPLEHDRFPRAMSLAVHELRTPVTVVCGYLRMVLKEHGGPLTDKQRKMLEEAERSCARISALVAEMSDLGKLEAKELAVSRHEVDMAALVAELASAMHEGDDRGVHLDVRVPNRPIVVTGDRGRLSAAITTLLHAALRERGEPGVIVAECSVMADTAPAWAILTVGDEATLPSLLQAARGAPPPFDEWRGGLGLALPVARRVVEALGGALWSAPGERPRAGSALRLPLRT
jgi:signal transduction histidine kinase